MYKTLQVLILLTFYNCSPNFINSTNYEIIKGELPVIIVVSHDGNKNFQFLPIRKDSTLNYNIKNDLNTRKIGKKIYNELFSLSREKPTLLINNVHRKYVDLNRDPNNAYESFRAKLIYNNYHDLLMNEINRMLLKHDRILLFDIHGFVSDSIDLVISTRNHQTILESDKEILLTDNNSIINNLGRKYNLKLNDPFYGGYTIKKMKNIFNKNITTIQLEFGDRIRFDKKYQNKFIKKLSKELYRLIERKDGLNICYFT